MGTDLTVARNPSILLASELTECLAKRYLNRARCLALTVSGEKVNLSCIATDVAPRAGFRSGPVSLIAHNGLSAILTGSIDWHYMTRVSFISGRFLEKNENDRTYKKHKTEKHLSQEGLHETVGFEKAHFSFRKC